MTIQTVQISNTFNEFRETTNLVIDEVNKLGDGTGNLVIDTIIANTFVGVSSDLNIVGDTGNDVVSLTTDSLVFSGANGISTSVTSGSNTVIVNLNNTGVSANTYGSASQIPVITVDAQGRITSASNASISSAMTVAGNTGNDVISFATETLRIVGTNGISTSVASGSNTVTINYDNVTTEIAANTLVHTFENPNYYYSANGDTFGIYSTVTDSYVIISASGEEEYPVTDPGEVEGQFGTGVIFIYDLETKNLVRKISGYKNYIAAKEDYLLAAPNDTSAIDVYQISTGKKLHSLYSPERFDTFFSSSQFESVLNNQNFRIHGDLVIAASLNDRGGRGTASVFNYKTGKLIWSRVNPNSANTSGSEFDRFGSAVDLYDNIAVVGAYWDNANNYSFSGTVYVFDIETDTLLYTITNPVTDGTSTDDEFGSIVAVGKDYIAIHNDDNLVGPGQLGKIYIYRKSDGVLVKTLSNVDIDSSITSEFGKYNLRFHENVLFTSGVKPGFMKVALAYDLDTNQKIISNEVYSIGGAYKISFSENYLLFTLPNVPNPFNRGVANLYTWKDVKKTSFKENKITDVQSIDFAFGKSIDVNSQLFNLPNIALKYSESEYIYSVTTPESITTNQFGKRVAATNNYIVASSNSTSNTGNVHVYDLKSGTLKYFLTNPNPVGSNTDDYFGSSIAADDTYLAVGSFEDDTANTDSGKVYVYRIDTGSLLYTLNNPNQNANSANDFFGASGLALANNYIAVGAHGESNTIYSNTGIVYVYSIPTFSSNTINTATRIIYNPEHANNDYFGSSIATDGRFITVGAYNKTVNGNTGAGKAYIFDLTNGYHVSKLLPPTSNTNDYFGYSVSMDDEFSVVGAYNKSNGANTVGAVYVYRTKSTANSQNAVIQHTLTNPNQFFFEANDQFGFSVSINSGKLAVGALGEDYYSANSGIIYLYDVGYSSANLSGVIRGTSTYSTFENDEFGYYIASNRNYIVTSSRGEDNASNANVGSIHLYATRPIRDIQVPELSQVERITFAGGMELTPTTLITTNNISSFTSTATGSSSNGASTLVQRDAEGNFSSNKVAANVVRLNGTVSGYVELKSASATSPVVYTLPTSDGTSGQVLQTNGTGGLSWVPQTGGGSPTGSGVSTARTLFTATAGQTVFTVPYVAGQIDVFMNGAKLVIGSDVTATNNTSISLTDPAASGDIIETVVYTSQWSTSGTSMFANTGLNVGIGTATPGARLHVASANTAFAIGQIRLDGANNAGNVNATVMFNAVTGGATNQGSQLYIETEDDSGILRERIRFDNQGRIGVGTQTPNSTLDVIGTITATYIAAPIVPRVTTITTSASITPNANTTDQYNITALAANTTFNVPTGIPSEGQKLMIKIKDNGAARGLTWTTTSGGYRAVGTTLPTTTSGNSSNVVYVGCIYNSQDVFWDVIAVTAS